MKLRSHQANNNEICRKIKDKLRLYEENKENMTIPERCVSIKNLFDIIISNAYWCRTYENFYRMIQVKFEEFCIYKEFIDLYSHREFKAFINFLNLPQTVEELKNNARAHHDILNQSISSFIHEQNPQEQIPQEQIPHEQIPHEQIPHEQIPHEQNPHEQNPQEQIPQEHISPVDLISRADPSPQLIFSNSNDLDRDTTGFVNRGTRRVYGIHPIERQQLEEFQRELEEFEFEESQEFQEFERPINTLFSFEYRSPLLENLNPIQNERSQEDIGILFTERVFEENNHPVVDDNKAEEHEKKCIVCQDNKPCVINTRCGHYICCGSCSFNIFRSRNNNCPVCREKWDSIIKVFQ